MTLAATHSTGQTSPLRIAVFGGGHLGTIHARLLQRVANAELVAIVEPSAERATELAAEFSCEIEQDVEGYSANGEFDGVVIAAPTTLHHAIGTKLLSRGIHCLIEKPLASTVSQCEDLLNAARQGNSVLQVGHVERFNPAWTAFCDRVRSPLFISATRAGSLTFRSMDAGVVLDLMIHDIDLVLSLVKSPITQIEATGFNWTGPAEDVSHARLLFANGCVAQLSASRVNSEPRRSMDLYGTDWSGHIDFGSRACSVVHGPEETNWQSRPYTPTERQHLIDNLYEEVLDRRQLAVPEANPIQDELQDFVTSIQTYSSPIVSGYDGLRAVEVANQILMRMETRKPTARTWRKAG